MFGDRLSLSPNRARTMPGTVQRPLDSPATHSLFLKLLRSLTRPGQCWQVCCGRNPLCMERQRSSILLPILCSGPTVYAAEGRTPRRDASGTPTAGPLTSFVFSTLYYLLFVCLFAFYP